VIIEIIGWYGTLAIVTGYILVSFNIIDAKSFFYQILNLTGALGIVGISLYKRTYQPAVLNVVWSLVALIALVSIAVR